MSRRNTNATGTASARRLDALNARVSSHAPSEYRRNDRVGEAEYSGVTDEAEVDEQRDERHRRDPRSCTARQFHRARVALPASIASAMIWQQVQLVYDCGLERLLVAKIRVATYAIAAPLHAG